MRFKSLISLALITLLVLIASFIVISAIAYTDTSESEVTELTLQEIYLDAKDAITSITDKIAGVSPEIYDMTKQRVRMEARITIYICAITLITFFTFTVVSLLIAFFTNSNDTLFITAGGVCLIIFVLAITVSLILIPISLIDLYSLDYVTITRIISIVR